VVDALVADVAVAGGPDPVPVVVQAPALQRRHRGRAAPQVVVAGLGHLALALGLPDAWPALVAEAAGQLDRADAAAEHQLPGLARAGHAAGLGAGLADALVAARGLDDAPALGHLVADRLLDVDVLAGLHGPDGGQRVPVVRGGDGDTVDRLVVEDLAEVLDVL